MEMPTVRAATKADEPRIRELHAEIEERLGRKMDLPAVDDPAILLFWVAEAEGELIGFHYQERAVEMCHGGLDPRATLAFQARQGEVFRLARELGVRFVHCQVPKEFGPVGRHLEASGFESTAEKYEHYVLDLR